MNDLFRDLRSWFSNAGKVVIVGVGNPIRKDDNVGVEVIKRLEGKVSDSVYLIESETVPENFLQEIVELKPTHVLVIDAAVMNLKPGEARLVEPGEMGGYAVSTHNLPLKIFLDYIRENAGSKVALLAVQPKDVSLGEGLTETLIEASKRIAENIRTILSK